MTRDRLPILEFDDPQLRSLSSPKRGELLTAFISHGPASVAEIAELMQADPKSLYYQVKALMRVGLVRAVGTQGAGVRQETVYDTVAQRYLLHIRGMPLDRRRVVSKAVKAGLSLAAKEYDQAILWEDEPVKSGYWRTRLQLSPEDADTLEKMITEVFQFAREHDHPGGPVRIALTAALAELTEKPTSSGSRRRREESEDS